MRFLVGEENGKINACITTSKEHLDYQFQYPGKNKVIKEYANIWDFYSWEDKENTVDVMTRKSDISPTIYDLRTPMKRKSEKQTIKKLSCYLINLRISRATKKDRPKDGLLLLSRLHLYRKSSLMMPQHVLRVLLLVSCIAKITIQIILDINSQPFNTEYK